MKRPERMKLHCAGCNATSWFLFYLGEWHCIGDWRQKRAGCGKILQIKGLK